MIDTKTQYQQLHSSTGYLNLSQYIPVTGAFLGTCLWHAKKYAAIPKPMW